MGIKLFERIKVKLRFLRRHRAQRQIPILTWEAIDRDAEAQLLEQLEQQAEDELSEFEQNLRNLN